jgi:dTDP-4-dehydrorhamnose reductase
MKIVIVGARGMLGTDLMQVLAARAPAGFDLPELDITDAGRSRELLQDVGPDVIIHAAAMTNVDSCETHAEEAFLVNGQGTGNLAAAAYALGAKLVYYSTDYVFDGTREGGYHEQDEPNPLSVYGKSKWRGEEFVRATCPDHLILRTSWLFGCHGTNFIRTIVGAARAGRTLRVVDDQRGSPTYTRDLAARTLALLEKDSRGTYHVTNSGSCTWYELARRSVEWANIQGAGVEPVKTHQFPRPAPRPACSILSNARMLQEGYPPMRPWQEAARDYVVSCLSAP